MEGVPLPWEVDLSCVREGITLEVASRKEEERKLAFPVQDNSQGYRTFEAQDGDTVAQLMNEVAKWCNEQRLL